GVEDRLGRADRILVQDLADELGHINVRGTRSGTWGVEAEQAASRLRQGFVRRVAGVQVGEVRGELFGLWDGGITHGGGDYTCNEWGCWICLNAPQRSMRGSAQMLR